MIYIGGCPIPFADNLDKFCQSRAIQLGVEGDIPSAALSTGQIEYLKKFSQAAFQAKTSRLLARIMALKFLPQNCMIGIDDTGKPVADGNMLVSFSHSSLAAWCLVAQDSSAKAMALDAEYRGEDFGEPAYASYLGKMAGCEKGKSLFLPRLWTIYEAILKTGDARDQLQWQGIKNARSGIAKACGKTVYWRSIAFMGHWLAIAREGAPLGKIALRWFNPCRLTSAGFGNAPDNAPPHAQGIE